MIVSAIPTGFLFVDDYSRGKLETLSIGDYGRHRNVKAKFLGYNENINGVPNGPCMPLSEKWVVTLSTQYGCPMKCNFCDVPNIPFNGNASIDDLKSQLFTAIRLNDGVKYTERLNIHFARMGEPTFNGAVFAFSEELAMHKGAFEKESGLRCEVIHPVLTTSMPKALKSLEDRLIRWCEIKNRGFNGQAGLQLSINSTSDSQRTTMFNGMALSLWDISQIANELPNPIGRKYCLNFAYSTDFVVNPTLIGDLFDPNKFMCKITPIHNNNACRKAGIETKGGYVEYAPYASLEAGLIEAGFDVLVFVPSMDEENGLVTCGNAVLGGSVPKGC